MRFSDSLDRRMEEVQRPVNPPIGDYIWNMPKPYEAREIEAGSGDTFDVVTFNAQIVQATDTVDPDELAEYGDVSGFRSRKTFMFNTTEGKEKEYEQTEFNLKRFLEHCGIDVDNMTMGEALAAAVGANFCGALNHRPDKNDPEVIYAEIGRTTTES